MAVKKRDPIFVISVSVFTFYVYALYWFYKVTKEMGEINKSNPNAVLWTIGLFIPVVNLYVLWKFSEGVEKLINKRHDRLGLFLMCILGFPAVQYLLQTELNKAAIE